MPGKVAQKAKIFTAQLTFLIESYLDYSRGVQVTQLQAG